MNISKTKGFILAILVLVGLLLFLMISARILMSVEIATIGAAAGEQKLMATTSLFGRRLSEGEIRFDGVVLS